MGRVQRLAVVAGLHGLTENEIRIAGAGEK